MAKRKSQKRIPISDEIRQAVAECGISQYRIWKDTGIDRATLSRFMSGERGLPMKTLDRLAEYLGLHITTEASKGRKRG